MQTKINNWMHAKPALSSALLILAIGSAGAIGEALATMMGAV